MTSGAQFEASAPTRLDFAGAWTDVSPFADEQRGVVVNAAIALRAHATVRPGIDTYRLRSGGERVESLAGDFPDDGVLPLLKAAARRGRIGRCSIETSTDAPPGSGLGTSGAASVALVAAMALARGEAPSPHEVAREAWLLETVDACVPGGQQDQYAAALGGFHQFTFDHGTTLATPLVLSPDFTRELAAHLVLCYTGTSRFSGNTIARVMQAYTAGDRAVREALTALAGIADEMAAALRRADVEGVGILLGENWREQQRLDAGMCTSGMAALESAMVAAGAVGGKAAGAGAGGSMFFIVPGDTRRAVAAATACGARVLPVVWAVDGVRARRADERAPV